MSISQLEIEGLVSNMHSCCHSMLAKLQLVLLRYMERLSNVTVGLDLDAGMQPIPYRNALTPQISVSLQSLSCNPVLRQVSIPR